MQRNAAQKTRLDSVRRTDDPLEALRRRRRRRLNCSGIAIAMAIAIARATESLNGKLASSQWALSSSLSLCARPFECARNPSRAGSAPIGLSAVVAS